MERLYGLDFLRGVAALVVLVMHIAGFAGGHLAVDFFFMLSGFVMARSYEARLRDGAISPLAFAKMRFKRLWPVMAVGAALGLNVAIAVAGVSADLFVAFGFALLMLPGSLTVPYLLNLPAWSIFYELLANVLHGAWFARLGNRALNIMLALCGAAFVASFEVTGFPRILHETDLAMQVAVVFRALVSYLIGVLMFRRFGDCAPVAVPLAAGAVLLVGYIALVSLYPFPFWPVPFVALVAPLALMAGLDRRAPPRLGHMLGEISFPLYAVHYPIITAVALAGLGAGTALVASLSVASVWLIGSRWPDPPRPAPAAA
ncbi:acyltransferase family protein [Erythrobacter sp.]|jgi:peptidoglycan/LPS O-acetylase OafA/YrhL|uniref:acyltransferase family protein n=1 Tax=Erythrobacter sp. TaxID=1042 RepID=UPI002EC1D599|nr:acyltransferase [Erythrobacter sp.]